MSTSPAVELALALVGQVDQPVCTQTLEQREAVTALLTAFGVEEKDIAGLAMLPGRPLLVIHRTGKTYRDQGRLVCDTEVRALR
jgi:hypothetical protein